MIAFSVTFMFKMLVKSMLDLDFLFVVRFGMHLMTHYDDLQHVQCGSCFLFLFLRTLLFKQPQMDSHPSPLPTTKFS